MKYKRLPVFCLVSLLLLVACSPSITTRTEEPAALSEIATPATVATPESTATATEVALQIPEGRFLVYVSLGDEGGEYQVINFPDLIAEPYEALNSEEWSFDWSYVLSPDGRYLAYDRSVNQDYAHQTLYVLNTSTGESKKISDHSQSNGKPTWTADGRYLEFDRYNQGLFIYDTQTGDLRQFNVSSPFSDASAISPDGSQIAYKGGCPGPGIACPVDLYAINSDGSGERFLEKGAMDWIFWSKDGRLIYYSLFGDRETYGNSPSSEESGYRLYSLDLESGTSQTVDDPRFNTSATDSSFLSPNGEFLLYAFGNAGLQMLRTSDGSATTLLPPSTPAWSPDSRYIVANTWEGDWYLYDAQTGQSITIEPDFQPGTQVVGWLP